MPDVPGYQHVFLSYFENEDYSQVIGNTKQALYLNSLRRGGATLTNFYAEEHPSDANYLALAGGSAFGVPLTDPEEENPLYNIDAANIGTSSPAAANRGRHTCRARTARATTPCTAITGTTTSR